MTILALTACAPSGSTSIAGEWGLVSYGDPANPTPAASDVETSIIFDENGQVNGTAGCNGFGGDYKVSADTIQFDSLFMTEMACQGPADAQERVLFKVFVGSAPFALDGDTLTITSEDGSAEVVLTRK